MHVAWSYCQAAGFVDNLSNLNRTSLLVHKWLKNKSKRYSRVPRLSDTRYSAKGIKWRWRYVSSKARL